MVFGPTAVRIAPFITGAIQIADGRRLGMTAVELGNRIILHHRPSRVAFVNARR